MWEGNTQGHPAAVGKTIYVAYAGPLEAIDLSTAKSLWKSEVDGLPVKPRYSFKITVMHKEGVAYVVAFNQFGSEGLVAAFDAASGKLLWKQFQCLLSGSTNSMPVRDRIRNLSVDASAPGIIDRHRMCELRSM